MGDAGQSVDKGEVAEVYPGGAGALQEGGEEPENEGEVR